MSFGNNNRQGGDQNAWTPNVFNDSKLAITGKPIADGGWNPRMRLKKRENNPCIEVSTGLQDKKGRQQRHDIPMSPRVLEEFLYVLEVVANYKAAVSYELENWNYVWRWNQAEGKSTRSDQVEVIGKISINKNNEGVVNVDFSFHSGKVIVPFAFLPDEYHKWMQGGNYMSIGDQSKIAALSWIRNIRNVVDYMYVSEWEEPKWERERRLERMAKATGQQGGGYNNNRQQGGGQRPSPQPSQGQGDSSFGASMDFDDVAF